MTRHSHSFGPSATAIERRGRRRLKIFLPVQIGGTERRAAHLLDVSRVGARCHAHVPPACHEDIVLHWNDLHITGHVIWVRANGFGVLFHPPLAQADVDRIASAELPAVNAAAPTG